ncbi:MAG: LuxR C-terminal-related transcriptional regulator, partial [Muribaculaceae bacterium]|nr:LuxR C-terminal-related transcriptional regulator [Muribaculaceae bacterium]
DVVRAVAKGLSNKEIAERLCLSVHTVTTHRRNISAKLDIHSAPGLTIYAIIHNLLSIDEIQSLQK